MVHPTVYINLTSVCANVKGVGHLVGLAGEYTEEPVAGKDPVARH